MDQTEQGRSATVGAGLGTRVEAGDRESQAGVTYHKILMRRAGGPGQSKLGLRGGDLLGEDGGGERKQKSHLNFCLLEESWPWEESCLPGYEVRGWSRVWVSHRNFTPMPGVTAAGTCCSLTHLASPPGSPPAFGELIPLGTGRN